MISEFVEPEWDPKYVRMLDAVIEYLDSIGDRDDTIINQRDITIIRSLIEFYDFEVVDNQDILDVMDDIKVRADQTRTEEEDDEHH